jgi:hypothetical protein
MTDVKNEIRSTIVREGMTMKRIVEIMARDYHWSPSLQNFTDKLRRDSLRYREAIELADALGYDIVWQKRHVS